MQKIIMYYLFTPLKDPMAVRLWQSALADKLNLRGRIIIAEHGINATLGGDIDDLKSYIKTTKSYPPFDNIDCKWSDGSWSDFPGLSVKVRPELVTFGMPDKLTVDQTGIVGGGKRLSPNQLHELVSKKGDDVIMVDGRNKWEAAIGKFKKAIVMDVKHTREFPKRINDPKYEYLKHKTVVTYCTGGIRCEVLTKLMLDTGYKEVYQLDGGIIKYLDTYGDDGLWEGSLYVFDKRISIQSSDRTKVIGICVHCGKRTSRYLNCGNISCNQQILVCDQCSHRTRLCADCAQTKLI